MTEIQSEDLRREHLDEFWYIDAVVGDNADNAIRERVYDSKRLLPFVDQNHAGTEVKTLFVQVANETGLQKLKVKINNWAGSTDEGV